MLEQQPVRTDAGCDSETAFEVARYGADVGRVGRLHDHRDSCDGLLPAVYDTAGHGLSGCGRCGEETYRQEDEAEVVHRSGFALLPHRRRGGVRTNV